MTEQVFQENELQLSFPITLAVEELDKQDTPSPEGMKLVDLVVEKKTRTLLIEIKDPSHQGASEKERKRYRSRIKKALIVEELTPKARDSYTFLHLMKRDSNPFFYLVLFGLDAFPDEKALLLGFKDRLLKRINQEANEPWKRKYIHDCMVMTVKQWNKSFPDWPVRRTNR